MAAFHPPTWEPLFAAASRNPKDDAAWSDLYVALWPYLTDWILSRYGLDPSRAADILQDALLQYRTKLAAGKTVQPSLAHLRGFVRISVLSALRDQSRLVSLDEIVSRPSPVDPEQDLLQKLMIDEALDRLDLRCAYVLRAKYFQGRTSAEIATALGLDTGHVDVILHRCRERCREILTAFSP